MEGLTQKQLKKVLTYNPDTGEFFRLKKRTNSKGLCGFHNNQRKLRIRINKKLYFAHRLAWLYMIGDWPQNEIDHIDGNSRNNKWSNLRSVDRVENMKNQKTHNTNTSGHRGVYRLPKSNQWQVSITNAGKRINLGSFSSFELACMVRRGAELQHGFHENHGRH